MSYQILQSSSVISCTTRTLLNRSQLSCYQHSSYQFRTLCTPEFTHGLNSSCSRRKKQTVSFGKFPCGITYQLASRQMHNEPDPGKTQSWGSIGKFLLVVWIGAALAIGVVVLVDWNMNVQEKEADVRKRKLERVKGNGVILPYLYSIPCMRNSALLAIVGGFTSWIVTFLLTSNPRKAYGAIMPCGCLIAGIFFAYCRTASSAANAEAETMRAALRDIGKRKVGESTDGQSDSHKENDNRG